MDTDRQRRKRERESVKWGSDGAHYSIHPCGFWNLKKRKEKRVCCQLWQFGFESLIVRQLVYFIFLNLPRAHTTHHRNIQKKKCQSICCPYREGKGKGEQQQFSFTRVWDFQICFCMRAFLRCSNRGAPQSTRQ